MRSPVWVAILILLLAGCGDEPVAIEDIPIAAQGMAMPMADSEPSVEQLASDDEDSPWWADLPRAGWQQFERIELPEDQGWFEVYRVAPGTWAIYEPGQWQEIISWLIEGEQRALLFDTGLGIGDIRGLAEALTDRPITVLNSHTHTDHVGGNHQFERILGTDTGYALENARGGSHEEAMADFFAPGAVWKDTPESFELAQFRTRPWTLTGFVKEDQIIDLGGCRLMVLATPGHAPDGISLLDAEQRILFVGDTYYPAPLYAHIPGADFDAYLETARLLGSLADRVDLVAGGHNEPFMDGASLLALQDAFERLAAHQVDFTEHGGNRIHDFGTFKVILRSED